MTTIPHTPQSIHERHEWLSRILVPELWASLAIVAMWITVLVGVIYGPDFVAESAGSTVTVPAAIFLGLFAFLGTWVVARYGFGRHQGDED
jgi:hypothetical protein